MNARHDDPSPISHASDAQKARPIAHIRVQTKGSGLIDITAQLRRFMDTQPASDGLLTVFCRHTSASLLIQENADPSVRIDLEAFFSRIAPESGTLYQHDTEGPDDMPAHLRTALTQVHLSIPVDQGRMVLGTWQGVYLFEHRHAAHQREVVLHFLPNIRTP
ncbi:secondary thiamine-phosphate synthase enzyme YjbQ [Robbsia andropogonis]|uniref:secondary thiamine-phosphate synthase enzyme YjbQ n=1 Tax=Robbsia andropogonis TaxID=28092 RepID=UPI00046420AA|nr:secondary thiamine-phosphate synthase enzyme YjbQ [Robbsia andropogonis]MCP1120785.1 secondary thiamine-phosphate synthase enzyme YjbQ [Robbsia andropogonis]MCP1130540.1 secondary thiamine-phosphate synthase enzyme YjbQ [Robbsia andropogonis]